MHLNGSIEAAEAILLRTEAIHPKVAMVTFNLAAYASVMGAWKRRKNASAMRSNLIRHSSRRAR